CWIKRSTFRKSGHFSEGAILATSSIRSKSASYTRHLVARISWADVWGRVGVEDHPSFREREFAVVDQDYRRPVNLRGRRIPLSSPSWEDATPSIVLLGCPPCRSRSMPIAVITYPGSGIG